MSRSRVTGTSAGRGRRVAAVLAVIAFVVGACNTAASPSAGASGGAAAPAAQFCQGMKLVFFPGGTPGGGFETVVYNGAKAAEAAFGPTVTYQWSDWDPEQDDHPVQRGRRDQAGRHRGHGPSRATTRSTR